MCARWRMWAKSKRNKDSASSSISQWMQRLRALSLLRTVQEEYLDQIADFQPRASSDSSDHDCGIGSHTAVTDGLICQ